MVNTAGSQLHRVYFVFSDWRRTCLDQGTAVVFDDKYNPEKPAHQRLPTLDMSNIMVRQLGFLYCYALHCRSTG